MSITDTYLEDKLQVLHLRLQAFQTMAKRESIKRAVERKTADFQRLFIDDLNMVKKQFDLLKRVPPADPVLPRYAGQATMALVLAKRVDNTWQALQVCLPTCLPAIHYDLHTFQCHLCTTTAMICSPFCTQNSAHMHNAALSWQVVHSSLPAFGVQQLCSYQVMMFPGLH